MFQRSLVAAAAAAALGIAILAGPAAAASGPVSAVTVSPEVGSFPYAPQTQDPFTDETKRCLYFYPKDDVLPPGCGGVTVRLDLDGISRLPGSEVAATAKVRAKYGCVNDRTARARTTKVVSETQRLNGFWFTGSLDYWRSSGDVASPVLQVPFGPVQVSCRQGETAAHLSTSVRALKVETGSYDAAGVWVRAAGWRVPGSWSS